MMSRAGLSKSRCLRDNELITVANMPDATLILNSRTLDISDTKSQFSICRGDQILDLILELILDLIMDLILYVALSDPGVI